MIAVGIAFLLTFAFGIINIAGATSRFLEVYSGIYQVFAIFQKATF
jgi:hypothetical protein